MKYRMGGLMEKRIGECENYGLVIRFAIPKNPKWSEKNNNFLLQKSLCSVTVHLHLNRLPYSLILPHRTQPNSMRNV